MSYIISDNSLDVLRQTRKRLDLEGRSVIDLSMINPDLPPARFLVDKLIEASMKVHHHRYAVSRGIGRLREAFALKYSSAFGVKLDAEREVCVTMATKGALSDLLPIIARPGERVLLPRPCYPAHLYAVRHARLEPCFFDLSGDEERWLASIKHELERGPCRVILLNFPNNPTGLTASTSFWQGLAPLLESSSSILVNDFVYGELWQGEQKPASALSVDELRPHALETYSLSKAYCVPGWRVGALLGSAHWVGEIARTKSRLDYGVFLPIQLASAAALSSSEDLAANVRLQISHRARLVTRGLVELGFTVEQPRAGASLWAELPLSSGAESASEWCYRLLAEHQVLLLPGDYFEVRDHRMVRIALVASEEKLREALKRIAQLIEGK